MVGLNGNIQDRETKYRVLVFIIRLIHTIFSFIVIIWFIFTVSPPEEDGDCISVHIIDEIKDFTSLIIIVEID